MHFDFSANQILWTLSFAAELVLLIVLLGRDRARRFPWFTAYIAVMALLLLVTRLLFGRMAPMPSSAIFLAVSDITAILGLLVVVEVARRAFAAASRRAVLIAVLIMLAVAVAVLYYWGPWPAWSTLVGASLLAILRIMQLAADKGAVFGALLDIELGILVVLAGRRFHAGWRSHPQQIAIGLSTAGVAQLVVRGLWQLIAIKIVIHSQAEYEHAMNLREHIFQANNVVFLLVLIWWIAWLWQDEPGTAAPAAAALSPAV